MASISSVVTSVSSKTRPPKLNNSARFLRVDRVPIIDTCKRSYSKLDHKSGKQIIIEESIDKKQLQRIFDNSRHRSEGGDHSPVFLGHTDDEGREIDQPPIAGWLDNFQMGDHNGHPAILADVYIDKEDYPDPSKVLRQFPRRSAEIIAISKPTGYIDSVALLKRTPERPLGLITSQYNKKEEVYRFACPACEKDSKRQEQTKHKHDVIKNVLRLTEQLVQAVIEEQGEDDEIDDDGESSSSSGEPSMATSTKVSRHKKEMMSSSSSEPSDNMSGEEEDPSTEPKMKKKAEKKDEPSRMDPSEPSRMKKKEKKSKMQSGGGAGYAGPTSVDVLSGDESPSDMSSSSVKKKSKMSSSNEVTRMRNDEHLIEKSRFKKELALRDEQINELKSQFALIASDKQKAIIERKLAQLQAEGYELDRVEEVSRFQKYFDTDEDVDTEITRMRKVYKQSPVGQGLVPSFSQDLGGSTVPRQKTLQDAFAIHPDDSDPRTPYISAPIIGSRFARKALEAGIVPRRESMSRGKNVDMQKISRFIHEESEK